MADSWQVSSAGTWAYDGLPAHPRAVAEAARYGLDLDNHLTREVSSPMLEGASLIVVMENNHREAITIEFPQVSHKVALLAELAGDLPIDVADPARSFFTDSAEITSLLCQYTDAAFENILTRAASSNTGTGSQT